MSLHVGMFANYFSIVRGGAESYVADLSAQLERLACRVTIVTGRSFFRRPAPAREGARILYAPCLYELREAGRLVPGRVAWLASAASESFYTFFARRHIGKFDIVHCHGYDTARAALDSPARRGPVVLTMHGAPSPKPRVGDLLGRLDAVVSPSEWIRDLVLRLHGVRAHLIPMGVDLQRFAPTGRAAARRRLGWDGAPAVLFVGRLIQEKDLPTLLRAFGIVARRRPGARLRIVGDGVLEARLQRQTLELGVSGSVAFLGARRREDLPHHYAAADVVVLPSVHENFPVVALEALACGARLVVSDAVDAITRRFPEVASFPVGDHERLACRLMEALEGRARTVGRARLEPCSWPRIASSYIGLYQDLVARRAA